MSEENKTVELKDKELKQVTGGTGENVNGTDGSGTINITINDMAGRNSYFTVDPEITVYDVKSLYAESEKCHLDWLIFVYEGQILDNSRTLASYNISNGSKLYMIYKRP